MLRLFEDTLISAFHLSIKEKDSVKYFNPFMLLPVPLCAGLLYLHAQHGNLMARMYPVCISAVIMIMCLQEMMYAKKTRQYKRALALNGIILIYLLSEHVIWIAPYYNGTDILADPGLYAALLKIGAMVSFALYIPKDEPNSDAPNWAEFRFRLFYQGFVSLIVLGLSVLGYVLASGAEKSEILEQTQSRLTSIISAISATNEAISSVIANGGM